MKKEDLKYYQRFKGILFKLLRHRASLKLPRYLLLASFVIAASFTVREFSVFSRIQGIEKQIWYLLFSFAVLLISLGAFINYYEYHGIGPQEGIYRRGPKRKVVALTFDDGPSPIYTEKILDVLKEKKVRATFFVVGKHVKKYKEIARRITEEGHEIGNHTYSHRDLVPAKRNMVIKQIKKTEDTVYEICGRKINLFRPPRGVLSNNVRKALLEMGYKIVLWSVSTLDWRMISAKQILKRVKRFTDEGSIILFHDSGAMFKPEGGSRENTVRSIAMVIDYLNENGFLIITAGEMLSLYEEELIAGEAYEEA